MSNNNNNSKRRLDMNQTKKQGSYWGKANDITHDITNKSGTSTGITSTLTGTTGTSGTTGTTTYDSILDTSQKNGVFFPPSVSFFPFPLFFYFYLYLNLFFLLSVLPMIYF